MIRNKQNRFSRDQMDRLLRPRSIAIIGASPTPGSFGASVLLNLEVSAYRGTIYLVNPKRSEIGGRPCLSSIDDLPERVDCAVLAIPKAGVLEAVEACARRKVGGAIIFSAGFAETGEGGRKEQERIREIARESGMVVEGPNCLGIVNHIDGIPLTFVSARAVCTSPDRCIALISQSGAIAAVLGVSLQHAGLGISYSVSTGNEAVAGMEDFLEYVIADGHTGVIGIVAEQIRQPKRFLDLVAEARDIGKHVLLLHPGRSSAARAAAATHTGAMAGDHDLMRCKVEHAGVVAVDTLETFLDVADILVRCGKLPRAGAAVLTESGFFKALTLDLCEYVRLPLPPLADCTRDALKKVLPDFIPPTNPLDITAQGLVDPGLYRRTLPIVLADHRYGSVVLAIILSDEHTSALKMAPIIDALKELRPVKPVIFAALDEGARVDQSYIDQLREFGVPFFWSAERALRALGMATAAGTRQRWVSEELRLDCQVPSLDGILPEYRAKDVLARAGIRVPAGGLATTVSEAQGIAARIGFPVALKAQASELTHKTDAGGVILNVDSPTALAMAWSRMWDAVADLRPGLSLDGVLVEKMARSGLELIVGARNDPEWGPVLLVGFGGVLAEALREVRLLPPDLSPERIAGELNAMKLGALLRGFRGSPALDIEAAAGIVSRVGALILSFDSIREIDINPVVVYPKGEGALALDALIVAEEKK